jgi:hypothetical protein
MNFTNFTTADGLSDIVIFHLFCDYRNGVWMVGLNGTVAMLKTEKFSLTAQCCYQKRANAESAISALIT